MRRWLERFKDWARLIRGDAVALYLATRDPRVSRLAKTLAVLIAAYVLSPIDLIPDFIPVIGYLDELILLPLVIAGVIRLIDPAVMAEHRAAAAKMAERPASTVGAALIASIWVLAIALLAWWLLSGSYSIQDDHVDGKPVIPIVLAIIEPVAIVVIRVLGQLNPRQDDAGPAFD